MVATASRASPGQPAAAPAAELTAVLRERLRGEHAQLERRLALPDSVAGDADYVRLLALWAAVWGAIAVAADPATAPGEELAGLARGARAAIDLDLADLTDLGSSRPAPSAPFGVPPDEASMWGAAYVLRGSSLGNRVLQPLIRQQLTGTPETAFRYLTGRGTEVRRDWLDFCRRLDEWAAPGTAAERRRTVTAAAATFAFVAAVADGTRWPGALASAGGHRPPS